MVTQNQQLCIDRTKENLRIYAVKQMSLHAPGIGGAVLPRAGEKFRVYNPQQISMVEVVAPSLSSSLETIMEARQPAAKTLVNNFMPAMQHFDASDDGTITLNLFRSNFREWKGSLPWADQYDSHLEKSLMRTPFNTAAIPVSSDGYFITPQRVQGRASHAGTLCLLNGMRYDRDLPGQAERCFEDAVRDGTGFDLQDQDRRCVQLQLNVPYDKIKLPQMTGIVSSEPAIQDYGYHIAYIAQIDLTAKEIVDAANEVYGDIGPQDKGRYVRVEFDKHVHPFEPDYLAKFSRDCIDTMAMTMQPILWLAGANVFGEEWTKKINFVTRR